MPGRHCVLRQPPPYGKVAHQTLDLRTGATLQRFALGGRTRHCAMRGMHLPRHLPPSRSAFRGVETRAPATPLRGRERSATAVPVSAAVRVVSAAAAAPAVPAAAGASTAGVSGFDRAPLRSVGMTASNSYSAHAALCIHSSPGVVPCCSTCQRKRTERVLWRPGQRGPAGEQLPTRQLLPAGFLTTNRAHRYEGRDENRPPLTTTRVNEPARYIDTLNALCIASSTPSQPNMPGLRSSSAAARWRWRIC